MSRTYTVHCRVAVVYDYEIEVEATDANDACEQAFAKCEDSRDHWEEIDGQIGPFVMKVAPVGGYESEDAERDDELSDEHSTVNILYADFPGARFV